MKKLIISVILAGILIFAAGCAKWKESTYDPAVIQAPAGFWIETEFPSDPADTQGITLLLHNDSDDDVYYGYGYYIEMQRDGKWYVVPDTDEAAFIEIAMLLPARTTAEYEITLEHFKSKPKPGLYRVVFNQMLTAEFELTEN